MEKFNKIKERGLRIAATVSSHHTGAFAAQAAYFFVLSLIPIFMLLLTMVQFYTSDESGMWWRLYFQYFHPQSAQWLKALWIRYIWLQVRSSFDNPCGFVVSGKRSTSVTYGLNCIYQNTETRNYFYLRARACMYTFLFLVASCSHWCFPYSATVLVL